MKEKLHIMNNLVLFILSQNPNIDLQIYIEDNSIQIYGILDPSETSSLLRAYPEESNHYRLDVNIKLNITTIII